MMKKNVLDETCLEERVFYRMVSGLHASINIHLSANYLLPEKNSPLASISSPNGNWGPNLNEFVNRFSPEVTGAEGQKWLRNLYFAFLVELRAIAKVAPYLRSEDFFTGIEKTDKEVQLAVNDLLNVIETFPSHFDESIMFNEGSKKLKEEFREKFFNITRIMDCVGCDKCRLWGKLQTQGMGTALKILFSGKFDHNSLNIISNDNHFAQEKPQFKMRRSEIVALFNAFGR
jgi:ERO1-like protein alpha